MAEILHELAASSILRAHGPDAERYLQGRITQNIKDLQVNQAKNSLVLSPQGKIQGKFLIARESAESFFIISDEVEDISQLVDALLQFKVADQLVVDKLENDYQLFHLISEDDKTVSTLRAEVEPCPYIVMLENKRTTNPGFDIIVSKENLADFKELTKSYKIGSREELERERIIAGIPKMGNELSEKTSVAEIPLEDLVSFNKGCYAGQEVVEMSIARGKPARRLIHGKIVGECSPQNSKEETHQPVPVGAGLRPRPLEVEIRKEDSESIGYLTSCTFVKNQNTSYVLGFAKTLNESEAKFFIESKPLELL